MFVIDASITLAWAFDDESSAPPPTWSSTASNVRRHWPRRTAPRGRERRCGPPSAAAGSARATWPPCAGLLAALPVEIAPVELSTALGSVLEAARTNDSQRVRRRYLDLALVRGLPWPPWTSGSGRPAPRLASELVA